MMDSLSFEMSVAERASPPKGVDDGGEVTPDAEVDPTERVSMRRLSKSIEASGLDIMRQKAKLVSYTECKSLDAADVRSCIHWSI